MLFIFLTPDANERLMLKLVEELRPGTRIVSNTCTFPGWTAVQQDMEERLYLYIVGKLI